MNKPLHISDTLALPLDFITATQAILAIKRIGKTYTASVQAEELLKAGQQIVAVDITGAWWGLRSNAAGDGPGFPIVIFGGDHGDVVLEESAGEVIAEAIVTERFSAILDLSLLRKGAAQRFLAAFFETLYRRNREAMHLFMDEADFYAPQKPFGEEARVLGAVNDIVRRGGIRGIGCTLITQRASVLNKDVLTQAGIVTALRVSHPRDIKAILEWVDVHASREDAAEMLRTLPSLPRGDAWVWAPGWPTENGIFKRVHIRQRETFDSGATPKAGHAQKQPKVIAKVDLLALGEQIASTVQRQKENDPKELKARIIQLEREAAKKTMTVAPVVKEKIVEIPALSQSHIDALHNAIKEIKGIRDWAEKTAGAIESELRNTRHRVGAKTIDTPVVASRERFNIKDSRDLLPLISGAKNTDNGRGDITRPMQRILDACAWMESIGIQQPKQTAVAFLAGYTVGGGAFNNPRGALRTMGLIDYRGDAIVLTAAGRSRANAPTAPLTNDELHAHVMQQLPNPEQKILRVLLDAYPKSVDNDDLAREAGYEPGGGAFNNPRGRLRTLGLVDYPERGKVRAAELLFI